MKKTLLVIIDGGADKGRSAYLKAKTPNLDVLAANSDCGIWTGPHAKGFNKRSLSSLGTMEILGYSEKDEPGRGYLEALGVNLKPKKTDVCLRANFATVRGRKFIDRRAGRDEKGLDELTKMLNRKIRSIEGVKIKFHRMVGHRLVVILSGKGLSKYVTDSDIGGSVSKIKPKNPKAAKTARILNEITDRTYELLSKHKINKKREFPANIVVLRAAGSMQRVSGFRKRFGMRAAAISGVNIILGISKYVGIDILPSPMTQLEEDLPFRVRKAINALDRYDFVILHINGADTNGHNKDFPGKVRFIEKIDREVFSQIIKLSHINVAVISDHETNSKTGEHSFGPVPFLIYDCDDEEGEFDNKFNERDCRKGFVADNPMKKILSVI